MVTNTVTFQPTLLDCWACRDLKRFRQVLKGLGAIVVTQYASQSQQQQQNGASAASFGKEFGGEGGGGGGAGSPSTSQGRSPATHTWGSAGNAFSAAPCPPSEVNRRDHLGRTVLHLIAASTEPVSIDYLVALLAHPSVNVNLQDHENGWTALHRALYHGNLLTALTLLKRSPPADVRAKDFEGLTPFDLYNSTVHGTNPPHVGTPEAQAGELFTWGANRNFTLGIGTSDDRALPDRVALRTGEERASNAEDSSVSFNHKRKEPGAKFDKIQVKDIGMSKFASVILTAERSSNVWVCGIGNTGRIGRAPQTQPNFEPLRDFHETASAISVGPDHTCILTTSGDVFTFGFNRFLQLGYALEHGLGVVSSSTKASGGAAATTFGGASMSNADLDVQISPRKVGGPLKKEHVLGIAAGKLHSAAFTSDALFTWGTNTGQLGYDRAATPTQIVPRKVTAVTASMSIVSIAVSDFATACLLASGDVLLLHNDAAFFVRFPQLSFSSQASVYRPRQATPKPSINKIVSGPNNSFAAISDIGDLWQFTPEHPAEYAQSSGTSSAAKATIKPQLIWSVRKNKKVGAARDVGVGQGQDLILVTESGHVFVRSRKAETGAATQVAGIATTASAAPVSQQQQQQTSVKGKSGWKVVPFLQRVIRVAMNESGGLAAIKSEAKIHSIRIRGYSLQHDLRNALPHLKAPSTDDKEGKDIVGDLAEAARLPSGANVDENDADAKASESDSSDVEDTGTHYISMAQVIAESARRWLSSTSEQQTLGGAGEKLPLGCDMLVIAGNRHLPAHRSVLSARLPILANALSHPPSKGTGDAPANVIIRRKPGEYTTMSLSSCSFGTALLLLHYIYTDDMPPIWTASIGMRVERLFAGLKMPASLVHTQLKQLADTFGLQALQPSLNSPVPLSPKAQLSIDFEAFFKSDVDIPVQQSSLHDVVIRFADDKLVPCHSVILRRSPFFSTLLQPHWTSTRWHDDILSIDMSHTRWEVARLVLLHLYTDKLAEVFVGADEGRSQDQFIDFVVEALAFSNELLLDKFKLVCCSLLRRRVLPVNIAAMMMDADFYHALPLRDAMMDYASRTMETLLESGLLDDLEHRMIKDLTRYVRQKQDDRLHRTRADEFIGGLVDKYNDYYFDLDIPAPSLGIAAARVPKRQPRSSDTRFSPFLNPTNSKAISGRSSTTAHARDMSSPISSPQTRPVSRARNITADTSGSASAAAANDESLMFSMDDDVDEDLDRDKPFALPASAATSTSAPWKSRSAEAQKARDVRASPALSASNEGASRQDLRSIMAAEQSSNTRQTPLRTTSQLSQSQGASVPEQGNWSISGAKLSQKDRKRQQQQMQQAEQSSTQLPTPPPSSTSSTPWKQVATTPSRPPLNAAQTTPVTSSANNGASAMSPSGGAVPRPPGYGPTYTPTRSRPLVPRRGVSGAATPDPTGAIGSVLPITAGGVGSATNGSVWASASTSYASLGTSPSNRMDTSGNASPAWYPGGSAHGSPSFGPALRGAQSSSSVQRPPRSSRASSGLTATAPTFQPPSSMLSQGRPNEGHVSATKAQEGNGEVSKAVASQMPKSFAQIQAEEMQQLEAMQAMQARAPKSFAELQEEDRRDNERKKKEEREKREFEQWFEQERQRMQKEQQQQNKKAGGGKKSSAASGSGGGNSGGSQAVNGKRSRNKGKEMEQRQIAQENGEETADASLSSAGKAAKGEGKGQQQANGNTRKQGSRGAKDSSRGRGRGRASGGNTHATQNDGGQSAANASRPEA